VKVLFIHMIGTFGGASRSLTEAVRAFPSTVEPHFVTPRGTVMPFFSKLGKVIAVRGLSQFDNTQYGYYRGARWIVLLREILNIPATIAAIRNAHRQWPNIDLIHINEFTGIFPMWIAKRLYQVPVVVHVRSVARRDDRSWRTRWVNSFLRRNASAIIAIDETVRQSLPADLDVEVIHNAFTPKPVADPDPAFRTAIAKTRSGSLKVGFVGNLLKVKGILDLVEAARIIRDSGIDVEYVVIGDDARSSKTLGARLLSVLGINQNIRAEVEQRLHSYDLAKDFHLVGFMSDIAQAYRSIDVLCFPSHYNAPGRPVFEAAFSAVPSIVAVTNPTRDTLVDGETGLAVPPHDPKRLAAAISTLANDRDRSRKMGLAAFELAKSNFSVDQNALKLYAVFRRCLGLSE
jgi:glycosyltransferase involved in cell wall biosynthesis